MRFLPLSNCRENEVSIQAQTYENDHFHLDYFTMKKGQWMAENMNQN